MPYLPIQVPIRFTVALVMLMLIAQAVQLKEISFSIENIIFYGSKRKIYFIIFPCNERRAFVVPQV